MAKAAAILLLRGLDDKLGAGFDTEDAAVEAHVVILGLRPCAAGVVLVVDLALLVLFGKALFRRFVALAVLLDDALGAAFHIRVDEDVQAVLALAQDIVRAAADDDAVPLLCQLLDELHLLDVQPVEHGQRVRRLRGGRDGKQQAASCAGVLAVLLDKARGEAAAPRNLVDQLMIVKGVAEAFGDQPADGTSAAAELTADGDNRFHYGFLLAQGCGAPDAIRCHNYSTTRRKTQKLSAKISPTLP